MTNPENQDKNDEILLGDLFRPLIQYRRLIGQGTVVAGVVAVLLGALVFVTQPSVWNASIGFHPTFLGSDTGKYPNGLAFAVSDINDASVVDQVFAKNSLESFCTLDSFRAGFSVQESSTRLQFLSAEFLTRLSDSRLTSVDRQRLQDEFDARKIGLPHEFRLMFSRSSECANLSQAVVSKALAEVLQTWATDSQTRRGVLKMRAAVLSPEVFAQPDSSTDPFLVRADLVRQNVERVIQNIIDIEMLPGAELVRAGKVSSSFAEVRGRLEDLLSARLEPLIATAGRYLGVDALRWINDQLKTSTLHLQVAESRAAAYRQAFREYSGTLSTPTAISGAADRQPQRSSDVQALTPQIDRTFVEGIVELSATNIEFRQALTQDVIKASLEVAQRQSVVDYYRGLQTEVKAPRGESATTSSDIEKMLAVFIAQAKDATQQLQEVYNEFSQVAFRPSSAMYRVEEPPQVTILKAFTRREYALLVLGVSLGAPVVLALACLVLFHLRRYVKSTVST